MPPVKTKRPGPDSFTGFLRAVAPVFHGQPFSYVDAGAYLGKTFAEVCAAPVALERALLFEPNPETYAKLERRVAATPCGDRARLLPIALSDRASTVQLAKRRDMSNVVTGDAADPAHELVTTEAAPLDSFADQLGDAPLSLLKVDVEGHELPVLAGAAQLLATGAISAIYIEAGFDRANRQQSYYRDIEDALAAHGYAIYRIYEQMGDWHGDRMALRRVNIGFLSPRVLDAYPVSRMKQLRAEIRRARQAQTP